MKYLIEKELCDPQNGNIVGPYYHVYSIDDNNKTLLKTFDGDIKEAARFAERQVDMESLEVAYMENPNAFKSCTATLTLTNKEKEILERLRELISEKRNAYIEQMNSHSEESPYYHYCRGKKDLLEDIANYIASDNH